MSITATITPMDFDATPDEISELKKYSRRSVHHGLKVIQEGSPFNPYLMYNQMFNANNDRKEQEIMKQLNSAWLKDAKQIHVYADLGINHDMIRQIEDILSVNQKTPIYRTSLKNDLKLPITIELLKDQLTDTLNVDQKIINDYKVGYEFDPKSDFSNIKGNLPDNAHFLDFKKVIMESPFAGDVKRNVEYAKRGIRYLATKKIAASASHLLYTQMLDDDLAEDRTLGIDKGIDIAHDIDSVFMLDRGLSGGMKYGYDRAIKEGRAISFDTLSNDPELIKKISQLKTWDDAVAFCDKQKQKNQQSFDNNGYIIPIDEPDKPKNSQPLSKKPKI